MTELSRDEHIERGRRARTLLGDELLQEIFQTLEDRIKLAWIEAKTVEQRERQHAELVGLRSIVDRLRVLGQTGEVEQKKLDDEERRATAQRGRRP